jgi:hypothetical protein
MKNRHTTEELTYEEVKYSESLNIINWGDQFKHFITNERVEMIPIKDPDTNVFIFAE